MYQIEYSKRALKDIEKLKESNLAEKAKKLVEIVKENPFKIPPPFEKLVGELSGFYSRRINIQHKMIYQVLEDKNIVRIISLWSHYENL